jgi:hypothetical protein
MSAETTSSASPANPDVDVTFESLDCGVFLAKDPQQFAE